MESSNTQKKSKYIKTSFKGKLKRITNKDKNNGIHPSTKRDHSKKLNIKSIFKKKKHIHNIESNINSQPSRNNSVLIGQANVSNNSNSLLNENSVPEKSSESSFISTNPSKGSPQDINTIIPETNTVDNINKVNLMKLENQLESNSIQNKKDNTIKSNYNSLSESLPLDDENKNKHMDDSALESKPINLQSKNDMNDNDNDNDKYPSNSSSRRSSITLDSCRTINIENENDNNTVLNEKEKENQNKIYENPTVITSNINNNTINNIKNIENTHFNDIIDEITLLKNKSHFDIDDHQNIVDLKLKNDKFIMNSGASPNKYVLLNNPKYMFSEPIHSNQENVITVNTTIVNLNKPNLESSSSDVNLLSNSRSHSNGSLSSKSKNKNENHSRNSSSNSSINTLNSSNIKYIKNDLLNNNHIKGYNHGSIGGLMNSPDNKNNNMITKQAIINNALKNNRTNSMGVIYSKRHNSMNNLNKLKLNINNPILLQTSSPKSAKSAKSNTSFDDSGIMSPLTPNLKRMNGCKYNDLLLTRRANSLKKEGISIPSEGNRNGSHVFNSSVSSNSINSNSSNGSSNKIPLYYNQLSADELELNSAILNKGPESIQSKTSEENDNVSLENWKFYEQYYKYINLDDLTFKSEQMQQDYEYVNNSLDGSSWKNDIPFECCFFCITNLILNLFKNNRKTTLMQCLFTFLPVLIIFMFFRIFNLAHYTKIKNIASVIIFTLVGPVNYLINILSDNVNTYQILIFSLNLIMWIFAGHMVLHTNFKYTRYSINICYLLCLIPFYYFLFTSDNNLNASLNHTTYEFMNNATLSNYSASHYPFTSRYINNLPLTKETKSFFSFANTKNPQEDIDSIQSLIKFKNKNSPNKISQKDEILGQEIKALMEKGNSIYWYVNCTLIPLNPAYDESWWSDPSIWNRDKATQMVMKNLKSKNNLSSESWNHRMSQDISLRKDKPSSLPSQYNEYELWVVVYESPSQPLQLSKFIIKYYYEKDKENRRYQQLQKATSQPQEKNGKKDSTFENKYSNITDILFLIGKNVITINTLVYFSILVSCYMINKLKYELDLSLKLQYLTNHQNIKSKKLALNPLQDGELYRVADFDSPIEKVIGIINQLIDQTEEDSESYELLNNALAYLNSSNLLLPDLERQLQGFVELEDEQKRWLLYEIAQQNYTYYDDSDNSSENSPSSISSPYAFYELSSIDILSLIDDSTLALLEKVNEYNFPIFDFCKATPRPLLTMSYHLFVKSGLLGRLHLNTEKFLNFIKEIEEGYHTDVTFHNACHITDVLHCMYYFTTIPNIGTNFKDWDLLSMFVAACIHDYDHPGLSNNFLIQTRDPLAVLYNDKSVLENHHCAMSFSILFKEKNNFLEHLDKEKFNDFREVVISLVLATDLAEHFQILSLFKKKILNISRCVQREDKILLMKILIKCADISNATKERSLYGKWVEGIMEEFYRQGDREKELNIPLSPNSNRDNPKPNSCQKSFVNFIASPIFEALAEWVYTCQSKPEPEEFSKSPTKSDNHTSMNSIKLSSKRNSINSSNLNDTTNTNNNIANSNTNTNTNTNPTIETVDENNNVYLSSTKSSRRSSLSYAKTSDKKDQSSSLPLDASNNNASSSSTTITTTTTTTTSPPSPPSINNNSLSSPSSPTLQERPLPGKKLSVGSIFKTDLSNRIKSGLKSKESAMNLMMKRERDIESRKKMDVVINGLKDNIKWVEANGLGA